MELFEAMRDIERKYPAIAGSLDLRTSMDSEVEEIEKSLGGRNKYSRAVEMAHERILGWLETAEEYHVELTFESLAHFAGSHRKACVWAVLIGKAMKTQANAA